MAKSEDTSDALERKFGKQPTTPKNVGKDEFLFSPRFRSVATMAGWDEEALMVAAFIVEDTPERQMKTKKRSDTQTQRTPSSDSRRKRRAQGRSPMPLPVSVIHLDEDTAEPKQEFDDRKMEIDHVEKTENLSGNRGNTEVNLNPSKTSDTPAIPCIDIDRLKEERKQEIDQVEKTKNLSGKRGDVEVNLNPSNIIDAPAVPCIDKLREELSCAICLEICYEPSTTPCGHSFCRKCLLSAADKCGRKCPKCRNPISNGRYSTVNTVLWNTIQLLFPQEVEARKSTTLASDVNEKVASPARITRRNRFVASLSSPGSERNDEEQVHRRIRRQTAVAMRSRVRTGLPDQDEDAALAFRLQREEFLEAFRERGTRNTEQQRGYPEELKAEMRRQLTRTQ